MTTPPQTLPAGPELDAALAEAFGWTRTRTEAAYALGFDPAGNWGRVPAYSTTWARAGLVIEEMHRRRWFFTLGVNPGDVQITVFPTPSARTEGELRRSATFEAQAPTVPHAVVLAALRAARGQSTGDNR